MKNVILAACLLASVHASAIDVKTVRTAGPYNIHKPLMIDSVDAAMRSYREDMKLDFNLWKEGSVGDMKMKTDGDGTYLSGFSFRVSHYTKVAVKVKGLSNYKVFIDGHDGGHKSALAPGQYDAVIRYVADTAAVSISVEADDADAVTLVDLASGKDGKLPKRPFSLADNMLMKHYGSVRVSPSGKFAVVTNSGFDIEGRTQNEAKIIEVNTGRVVATRSSGVSWMPRSDKFLFTRKVEGKDFLVAVDPIDLSETIISRDLPSLSYVMSPTEDFIIFYESVEGPRRENGVYEILTPDDRQPGWRNRSVISKMDLKSGLIQPLVFAARNVWINDVSQDGKTLIFSAQTSRLSARPTSLTSVYRMNLETLESELLIDKDGFISDVSLIPGTSKLAVVGGAEAFGSVGNIVPDGMIPNSYDHQLFIFDMNTHKADPVTKTFNPSIEKVLTCQADGMVYFTAQNADSVSLYRLDVRNGKIQNIQQPVEVIQGIDISANANTLLYYGMSAVTSDRLYSLNTKNLKYSMLEELNAERMAEVQVGECRELRFRSKNGYDLTGHYYLPADFNPSRKYPVIVHYYGGCSPTARRFGNGSHYPAHYWNSLGYVVLILNPRGASGFGQEWAAWHVNTAGEGIAEDIIEATKYFADNNSFVNADKIGCVSASYGGFMTQLLLTKTDMFATGISHAGISDHTSYWGEGYWGYSYSEVSMADSYPWTRRDLYVDRSPLFNADKIHKPILFTHGTADTNVPIGESIQMYTALKLLGVPTAFVMVEGENHGIMDYTKRQKWINTMVAWFAKYLQDDPQWWDAIYTPKENLKAE